MNRFFLFSAWTAIFLGGIKMLSIVPFVRLSMDDFGYTASVFQQGFWGAQAYWYSAWSGRFFSTFLQTVFGRFSAPHGITTAYTLLTLMLLLLAFLFLFSAILKTRLLNPRIILLSALVFVVFYILTPDKMGSWYWLTGSASYLWPLICLLLVASQIFRPPYRISAFIICSVLTFLAAAGNETLSIMLNLGLAISLFLSLLGRFPHRLIKLLSVMLLASVLSFSLMYLAPGNVNRNSVSDNMNLMGSLSYSLEYGPFLAWSFVRGHLLFTAAFIFCAAYIFSLSLNTRLVSLEYRFSRILLFLAVPFVAGVLFVLPAYKVQGQLPPTRSYITLTFVVLICLLSVAYHLSGIFHHKKISSISLRQGMLLPAFILFVSSFTLVSTLGGDLYIARNYSVAFDRMFNQLRTAARVNPHQTVSINRLPESGLVSPEKIMPNPDDYSNKGLSDFFGLDGVVPAR
jgi:hypothetical protein